MFAKKNIEKRIMSVIKSRIENAQKAFDTECTKLDDDHQKAIISLEERLEIDKTNLENQLVSSVLGKLV